MSIPEYKAIFTHNPQDYYNGIEPEELVEQRDICDIFDLIQILEKVNDGYKAIVELKEGSQNGRILD